MNEIDIQDEFLRIKTRVADLERIIDEHNAIFTRVGEAMEKAKGNPMVANLMRMFGVE